jgi:hypothetical protein
MKHLLIRWTIRIGVGIVAAVALVFGVLFFRNPEAALLLILFIIQPLISNSRPPAVVDGQMTAEDWGHWNDFTRQSETSRKIGAILQRQFQIGTSEATLKATLLKQGFKPPRPPLGICLPEGETPRIGQTYHSCPTEDPHKSLRYEWGRIPCGEHIAVRWTTGSRDEITSIRNDYGGGCL